MAESTPGNLFGGFAVGRVAEDSRGIDRATDRLEEQINKFADAMEKATVNMGRVGGGGSSSQTVFTSNGGGATFGGEPMFNQNSGSSGGSGGSGGGSGNGGQPTGGTPTSNGGWRSHLPSKGQVAVGAGVAALSTIASFNGNHQANMITGEAIAMGGARGPDWNAAYQNGIMKNWTAHSDADALQYSAAMSRNSGYTMASDSYSALNKRTQSYSAVNPGISNVQGESAVNALGSAQSFNALQGMGVTAVDQAGRGDPRSLARQILAKMGAHNVKTAEQVAANFAPAGNATVTLNSWLQNGLIPPEAYEVVRSEMLNILTAQVNGMSYEKYNSTATAANGTTGAAGDARKTLAKAGIAADTVLQQQRAQLGAGRETEGKIVEDFTAGLTLTTNVLTSFREALNSILGVGPIGEIVGFGSGASGLLSAIPGVNLAMKLFGGDGPASMASGSVSYGGKAAAYGGGGGGGMSLASGSASASSYSTSAKTGTGGGTSTGSGKSASSYDIGPVKPWVAKAAAKVGPMFGISVIHGVATRTGVSDHPKGLALDFMCSTAQGNKLAPYVLANRKDLSVSYIIWRQRIWSVNNPSWRQMEDRGSITANHYDHVHVSFLAAPTGDPGDASGSGGSLGRGGGRGGGALGGSSAGDNGGSEFTGSGGSAGGGGLGGYSEVAALGIGAGGGGGGVGTPGTSPESSVGGRGGGGFGGPGNAGSASIGAYNVLNSTSNAATQADLAKIMGKVDTLALNELMGHKNQLGGWIRQQGWGYYKAQGAGADTGLAWDKDDYNVLKTGSRALNPDNQESGGLRNRFAAYALLQDKNSGAKFWQISAHTVPGADHGGRAGSISKTQFDSLAKLRAELGKSGIPVILSGDLNSHNPNVGGFSDSKFEGIDHIMGSGGAQVKGMGTVRDGLSSDHPFAYANVALPGSGGAGGGKSESYQPSAGVAQWRDEVVFVMQKLGIKKPTKDMVDNVMRQMAQESSGNPTIVNTTDSNWDRGTPSVGLMQVIGPTFQAYAGPYKNTGPFKYGSSTDPIANIYAGLNYARQNYGSLQAAFGDRGHIGYAQGSWQIREDQDTRVHKGEMIIPSKIADILRDELTSPGIRDALSGGKASGGGIVFQTGAIVVQMPNGTTGSRKQMEQAGRWFADEMMADHRIRRLAEGV